ncbi:MAG: cytidylate kinase-like family protein [Fimbriimonadales bacterium]|nr:cytidylate kinase-like family protein [Fimbriimonadales bacterium]
MSVVAISRQFGSGSQIVASHLAEELGWRVVDREILEEGARVAGIPLPNVVHRDERAPSLIEAWARKGDAERYFQAILDTVRRFAADGRVIFVGRGAGFILRDRPCLHVRLVADLSFRVRRVMQVRWVGEDQALAMIRTSDEERAGFHRRFFNVDWSDPANYHVTLSTSLLGPEEAARTLAAIVRAWPW